MIDIDNNISYTQYITPMLIFFQNEFSFQNELTNHKRVIARKASVIQVKLCRFFVVFAVVVVVFKYTQITFF